MEQAESQPKLVIKEGESGEFSPISILISIVLSITFIVLIQFLIRDLRESFIGEEIKSYNKIKTDHQSQVQNTPGGRVSNQKTVYMYEGVVYENYDDAQKEFNRREVLPYKTKTLLISGVINIPLFILGLYLFFVFRNQKGSGKKLASAIFFGATLINIIVLLGEISGTLYKVNPRIAVYTISLALIVVLVIAIIKIQERFHKPSTPSEPV